MSYKVVLSQDVIDSLRKMDNAMGRRIFSWILKNLEGCENPRRMGKALVGNHSGEWRYRVGDYRLLAKIDDEVITIYGFEVGHRSNIYNE